MSSVLFLPEIAVLWLLSLLGLGVNGTLAVAGVVNVVALYGALRVAAGSVARARAPIAGALLALGGFALLAATESSPSRDALELASLLTTTTYYSATVVGAVLAVGLVAALRTSTAAASVSRHAASRRRRTRPTSARVPWAAMVGIAAVAAASVLTNPLFAAWATVPVVLVLGVVALWARDAELWRCGSPARSSPARSSGTSDGCRWTCCSDRPAHREHRRRLRRPVAVARVARATTGRCSPSGGARRGARHPSSPSWCCGRGASPRRCCSRDGATWAPPSSRRAAGSCRCSSWSGRSRSAPTRPATCSPSCSRRSSGSSCSRSSCRAERRHPATSRTPAARPVVRADGEPGSLSAPRRSRSWPRSASECRASSPPRTRPTPTSPASWTGPSSRDAPAPASSGRSACPRPTSPTRARSCRSTTSCAATPGS